MNILECSSKGDKRFSAFYAKVSVFGKVDSIEHHYQRCKKFNYPVSNPKGKKPTHIEINGVKYDIKYLTPFYKLLWIKYLDQHPELVKYARTFDEYNDMFKGKSVNCQADVIREYIRNRTSLLASCKEFVDLMKSNTY